MITFKRVAFFSVIFGSLSHIYSQQFTVQVERIGNPVSYSTISLDMDIKKTVNELKAEIRKKLGLDDHIDFKFEHISKYSGNSKIESLLKQYSIWTPFKNTLKAVEVRRK